MALEEERPPEMPEWIVTYGDMMSLLLTLFVMIASFSEVREQEKYQAVASSMRNQFGHDLTNGSVVPGWTKPRSAVMAGITTLARMQKHDWVRSTERSTSADMAVKSGDSLQADLQRTQEFLEQQLGIPAERIRISATTGKEATVEIHLTRETGEE